MKEKILAELKTKFQGVSEAILARMADKLAKTITTEDGIKAGVDGVTFQSVLESYTDSRVNEAIQTAIKNYEAKHGIKDGKPVKGEEPPITQPTGDDKTPEWAKAIISSNNELKEKLKALEGANTKTKRSEVLNAVIKELPDSYRKTFEKNFNRMSFEDDADFDNWMEEVKTDSEELKKELIAKGALVAPPKGGNGGNPTEVSDEQAKAVVAKFNS